MATTQYIGARYVPLFADPAEWNSTRTYEPLTIVMHDGNSYTSRQYVPKGIDISNDDFWALTGNYNAQVETYRKDVLRLEDEVDAEQVRAEAAEAKLTSDLASEVSRAEAAEKVFFKTVTEMKAATNLSDGMICHTNGFHQEGDNGGAWYIINAEGTANEMNVITCGNLFATFIPVDAVTPEMVGAYGDGIHDDTESLRQCFKYGNINLTPEHIYLVSKIIYVNNDVSVNGNNATIKVTPINNTRRALFEHTGANLNCTYRNLRIESELKYTIVPPANHDPVEGDLASNIVAFRCTNKNYVSNMVVDNVDFNGIAYCFEFVGGNKWYVNNCKATNVHMFAWGAYFKDVVFSNISHIYPDTIATSGFHTMYITSVNGRISANNMYNETTNGYASGPMLDFANYLKTASADTDCADIQISNCTALGLSMIVFAWANKITLDNCNAYNAPLFATCTIKNSFSGFLNLKSCTCECIADHPMIVVDNGDLDGTLNMTGCNMSFLPGSSGYQANTFLELYGCNTTVNNCVFNGSKILADIRHDIEINNTIANVSDYIIYGHADNTVKIFGCKFNKRLTWSGSSKFIARRCDITDDTIFINPAKNDNLTALNCYLGTSVYPDVVNE